MKFRSVFLATLVIILNSCGLWQGKKSGSDEPPVQPQPAPLEETAAELSEPPLPEVDKGLRLRGNAELSRLIESSMLSTSGFFYLSTFIYGFGLDGYLGYYDPNPVNPSWQNVNPTTVSVSVHLLAFSAFSRDMANNCRSETSGIYWYAHYTSAFANLVSNFCRLGTGMPEDDLREFWRRLTAEMVPETEFPEWKNDLKAVDGKSFEERLEFAVSTALMSPQVLFHH